MGQAALIGKRHSRSGPERNAPRYPASVAAYPSWTDAAAAPSHQSAAQDYREGRASSLGQALPPPQPNPLAPPADRLGTVQQLETSQQPPRTHSPSAAHPSLPQKRSLLPFTWGQVGQWRRSSRLRRTHTYKNADWRRLSTTRSHVALPITDDDSDDHLSINDSIVGPPASIAPSSCKTTSTAQEQPASHIRRRISAMYETMSRSDSSDDSARRKSSASSSDNSSSDGTEDGRGGRAFVRGSSLMPSTAKQHRRMLDGMGSISNWESGPGATALRSSRVMERGSYRRASAEDGETNTTTSDDDTEEEESESESSASEEDNGMQREGEAAWGRGRRRSTRAQRVAPSGMTGPCLRQNGRPQAPVVPPPMMMMPGPAPFRRFAPRRHVHATRRPLHRVPQPQPNLNGPPLRRKARVDYERALNFSLRDIPWVKSPPWEELKVRKKTSLGVCYSGMMSLVAHKRYSDEGVVECDEELLLNTSSSSHGRRHSAHHKTPHEVRELISLDGTTPAHPDKSVSHTHKSLLLPVIHPGSHKETRSEEAGEEEEDNARRDRGQTIIATIAKKKKGEEATVLSKRERAAIAEQLRVTEAEQHRGGPPPPPPPPAPSAKDKENARLHERRADPDYASHHRRQRHTRRSLSGEMGCSNSSFGTAANRILRRRLSAAANRVDVLPPPTRPFGEAARSVTLRRRRPRRASQEGVSVSSTSSSLSGHYDRSSMSSTSSLSSSTSSAYWSRPWEDAMSTGSHSIEHVEEQEYIESMKQEEFTNKKEEEEKEEDEVVVLERVEAKASLENSTTSLTPRVSFGWQDTMQDSSEKRDVKDEGKMTAQPAKSVSSASARKASAQSAPVLSATALMTKSASRGSGEAALPVVTRHASLQSNGSNVSSTGQGGGSSGSLASSNNSQYSNYGSFLYGNGSANAITATMTTTKAAEGISKAGIPQPPRLLYETRSNSSHSNSSNNGSGMGLGSPRDSAASLSWLMYSARSSTYSSTSSNGSGSGSGGGGSKEPNVNGGIAAGGSEEDIYGSGSSNSNNKMVGNGKGQQQHVTSAPTTHHAEKTASPPLLKPHEERLTLPLLRAVRPLSQPSPTRAVDESKAEEAGPVKLHHSSAAVSSIAVDRPQTTLHTTTTTTTPSHTQCHLGQRTVEWSSSSSTGYDKLPNGVTRPNSATSQRTGRRMNRRVSFIGEIR